MLVCMRCHATRVVAEGSGCRVRPATRHGNFARRWRRRGKDCAHHLRTTLGRSGRNRALATRSTEHGKHPLGQCGRRTVGSVLAGYSQNGRFDTRPQRPGPRLYLRGAARGASRTAVGEGAHPRAGGVTRRGRLVGACASDGSGRSCAWLCELHARISCDLVSCFFLARLNATYLVLFRRCFQCVFSAF